MIHLIKQNGKFRVVDVAPNHEMIKESQRQGLTTRKAAIKNIRATAKLYDAKVGFELRVQDDTGAQPRIIIVTETRVIATTEKAGRPYVPGKTKSPGKAQKRVVTNNTSIVKPSVASLPPVKKLPSKTAVAVKKTAPKKAAPAKKAAAKK